MSKARSPREVCSTTIGTRGLMGATLYRWAGPGPRRARPRGPRLCSSRARRPDLAGFLRFLVGRPQLLARLGLLERDRLAVLDDQVDRLAHRDVLAQRLLGALRAGPLQRPLELLLAHLAAVGGGGGRAQRVLNLVLGHLDALGLDDRAEHRLALERQLRLWLCLGDELLLLLAGHLEVLARGGALGLETAGGAVPHLLRLRVPQLVRHVHLRARHRGVDRRLA